MQIKVLDVSGSDARWYRNYAGEIFDVEPNSIGFTLLNTSNNHKILNREIDSARRKELLIRLKNEPHRTRLGVNSKHAELIQDITSNKQGVKLLSKEW